MKIVLFVLCILALLGAKELEYKTSDGFLIKGWLDIPKNPKALAVFAHQFGADSTIWSEFAKKMERDGFATLLIDLRGHGKSILQNGKENKIINDSRLDHLREALKMSAEKVNFTKNPSDIAGIIKEAKKTEPSLPVDKLILFGSSLGGGASLASLELEPKALVLISTGGFEMYGADEVAMMLSATAAPILFVVGKDDPLGAQKRSIDYANKSPFTTLIQISSDGHGTVLLPKVENYIFDFLKTVDLK